MDKNSSQRLYQMRINIDVQCNTVQWCDTFSVEHGKAVAEFIYPAVCSRFSFSEMCLVSFIVIRLLLQELIKGTDHKTFQVTLSLAYFKMFLVWSVWYCRVWVDVSILASTLKASSLSDFGFLPKVQLWITGGWTFPLSPPKVSHIAACTFFIFQFACHATIISYLHLCYIYCYLCHISLKHTVFASQNACALYTVLFRYVIVLYHNAQESDQRLQTDLSGTRGGILGGGMLGGGTSGAPLDGRGGRVGGGRHSTASLKKQNRTKIYIYHYYLCKSREKNKEWKGGGAKLTFTWHLLLQFGVQQQQWINRNINHYFLDNCSII